MAKFLSTIAKSALRPGVVVLVGIRFPGHEQSSAFRTFISSRCVEKQLAENVVSGQTCLTKFVDLYLGHKVIAIGRRPNHRANLMPASAWDSCHKVSDHQCGFSGEEASNSSFIVPRWSADQPESVHLRRYTWWTRRCRRGRSSWCGRIRRAVCPRARRCARRNSRAGLARDSRAGVRCGSRRRS